MGHQTGLMVNLSCWYGTRRLDIPPVRRHQVGMTKSAAPPYHPIAASLWMIGSIAAFLSMAIAARQVSAHMDTFEIMTWRSLIGFVIVAGIAYATRHRQKVHTDRIGRHLIRNIAHFSGQNLWFWALTMIPLAQVFALEFTSPIWVILLAPVFLGETLTRTKLVAAFLGFTGALIVANPDFGRVDPGVLAAAACAVCFAATAILTKRLTQVEGILSILFWLTLMQLGMALILSGYDGDVTLPNAATLPGLLVIGLAGLVAHYCLTKALSLAPASTVVPIDFIRLPFAALLGWLLFDETVAVTVFIGAGLIMLAIWLNLRAQTRAIA